jgi:uncharacterized membrane protein YphA (DoxX/SURF4 family)
VPCDPAQVIVNHASFRVEFASRAPVGNAYPVTAPMPRTPARRGARRPLVWSGRAAPGDPGAGSLLQAVRDAGGGPEGVATQVLPRITDTAVLPLVPAVVGPREPEPDERAARARPAGDVPAAGRGTAAERPAAQPGRPDARQGYYPGRRLSLGIVLLPLRLLLGFITITAGFAKLTDPVYFDGGERGSMVSWLSSLEPWALASPLHEWALAHPVGAGLSVAFTQIIVGVLTMAGLWQRLAAILGALLSLALLVTVSWQTGPAYDAPDIILLAAWSPLIIAGAPVYSLDGRLSAEAWRTLGPRVRVSDLRRRVLRRGGLLAMLLLGGTLLLGSLLGGAVRSAELTTVPRPGDPPRNSLPGTPVPGDDAEDEVAEEEAAADEGAAPGPAGEDDPPAQRTGPAREDDPSAEQTGPAAEQTVPDSGQQTQDSPPAEPGQSTEEAAPPPPPAEDGSTGTSGGTGGEEPPPDDSGTADEGGEEGSPGPIGGLLG